MHVFGGLELFFFFADGGEIHTQQAADSLGFQQLNTQTTPPSLRCRLEEEATAHTLMLSRSMLKRLVAGQRALPGDFGIYRVRSLTLYSARTLTFSQPSLKEPRSVDC